MPDRTYPSDSSAAALQLFLDWVGAHYARSTELLERTGDGGGELVRARAGVGRKWELAVTLLNTLPSEATLAYEAARAAIERRLDDAGRSIALWAPRGAPLPAEEPRLSELMVAIEEAKAVEDGRLEVKRTVPLFLRRTSREGSVITVLGGLSGHWAQFTNRVPGSFQLNSAQLFRLPASTEERAALAERIVLAAQQPDVDESITVAAEDAWTANELREGPSCVFGSPVAESDDASAGLRRTLRRLLKEAGALQGEGTRALVLVGASTYAEEEKLSWVIRGIDPTVYGGYDIVAVLADGVVKALLEPPRQTLPWDAPLR